MEESQSSDIQERSLMRNLRNVSVLYVEDEEYLRERLARILERRIDRLHLARNGKEGLDIYQKIRPDIVITDIRMPIMDGLEMSQEIKRINESTPIVITTAHNDEEFLIRAIDIGIDKYLKKPINRNDILKMLGQVARSILQQKEIESKNALLRMIMDTSPEIYIICDENGISYVNRSFLNFMGTLTYDEFLGKGIQLESLVKLDNHPTPINTPFCEFVKHLTLANSQEEQIISIHPPGESEMDTRSFLLRINPLPGQMEILAILSDVTTIDRQKRHFEDLSVRDPLTGIFNRKKFNEEFLREIERAQRYRRPLSLIMLDIDHFKNVNDTYGHQAGDMVLHQLVKIVSENIRKTDIFARYGGEEFVVILPETVITEAFDLAEKLRNLIEENKNPQFHSITCSFGVAEISASDDDHSFLARSDSALYSAKKNGRNRVECG